MNAFLERLGRVSVRWRWWVIGLWVVILVGLSVSRNVWGGEFANDYSVPGSPSQQGVDLLARQFPQAGGNAGQIVFHATTGIVADQKDAVATTMKNVGRLPHVVSATDPFSIKDTPTVAKDETIAYGPASWNVVPASLPPSYVDKLDTAVAPARQAGLTVEYGGAAGQIGKAAQDRVSEIIGLSAALILLLLMFGSLVAAGIPLVAAVFSVGTGLAIVGLLAATSTFPTAAPTVATLLGLGVAIDYGLFLVARHREQIDHGMSLEDSIPRAQGTSGAAIVVAGTTVVIAILGLYVSGVPFVGKLGLAAAIVVAVTMAAALTLTPALMAVAGNAIRSRSERRASRAHRPIRQADHANSAFARWGRMVSDRPWPWGIASVGVLVLLAIPVFSLRLGQLDAGTDPTTESSRRAYDLVAEGFGPGANGPLSVVLELSGLGSPTDQQTVQNAQKELAATKGVASVGPPQVNDSKTIAVLNVIPTTSPDAAATTALVKHLRSVTLLDLGVPAFVVGTTAGYVDFTTQVGQRMIYLIGAVVLLALVLLTVAFRSLAIAIKAAILNLLSVAAAYGVVVAIFEWGWGSGLIGIHQSLPIPAFVPMLMFAIIFGLSMDYEVFLLSRVHEAWMRTGDAHQSVAIGIGSTARVITTAAAIMIVVFTSFVLDPDPTIKMLAVGMAVAVLIDASLVRMVLVPSIMTILGRHAWWLPRWMEPIIPNLELEGSVEEYPPVEPDPGAGETEEEAPAPVG